MSTSGHTLNGKRREWFPDGGLGVPGDPGGEEGKFHGSGFASGTMRSYGASAECAQEIKRWIRKMLTFAAASLPVFARAEDRRRERG